MILLLSSWFAPPQNGAGISSLISAQIPEHIRETYPLFVGFVETYYRYTQQEGNSIELIQNRVEDTDIDLTDTVYLDEFFSTYGKYIPQTVSLDKRNLLKLFNSIYCAKGTEKALKLLFQAVFGEVVEIYYPGENVLKASDSVWISENFISISTISGIVPGESSTLTFKNSRGTFSITPTKVENLNANVNRFYFHSVSQLFFDDSQIITATGDVPFTGRLIKSPAKISILTPGKFWSVGQVITIPGTVKPTIARVTRVSSIGSIESIEILEYGYDHAQFLSIVVSPFQNRPSSSEIEIDSILVSANPNVFHHTITVGDIMDGIGETIGGFDNSAENTPYFSEIYFETDYIAEPVFSQSLVGYKQEAVSTQSDVSLADWFASRAILLYNYDNVVKTKGYYQTDTGHLSNQEIRLQDNFYYQPFSYVINSTKNIGDYKNLLNITHPAGTKRFSELLKTGTGSFTYSASRTLSIDTLFVVDTAYAFDAKNIGLMKPLSDSINAVDTVYTTFGKSLSDSAVASNTDVYTTASSFYQSESYYVEDYSNKDYSVTIN